MSTNIEYERFSPHTSREAKTTALVHCYQEVFAEGPWNELMKCQDCGKNLGREEYASLTQNQCPRCDGPLVEFWPTAQVRRDLEHEIQPETSCWIALSAGEIIGFCWGYPIDLPALEAKLGIAFSASAEKLFGQHSRIAYQDEVGVMKSFRGRKIAKAMVMHRHEDFLKMDLTLGVVRTKETPEPSDTYSWYTKKLGYEIVARYPAGDGRVILANTLDSVSARLMQPSI